MRTLLFDIDGTLLLTNNSGSGALKQAIEEEFGLTDSRVDLDFSGRTDRSILVELLEKNSLPTTPENQLRLEKRYVDQLPRVLADFGGYLLPGVTPLLAKMAQRTHVRCCVMTGNLISTANVKLNHFGLASHFLNVFGGDHDAHRDDLARRAASDLVQIYGDGATDDLVVIGDTSADVLCGHAIGAKVVAVATGSEDQQSLSKHRPHAVVDDLSDTEAMVDLLTA
ncbi:Phosphoglycolate phosphatase [Rubripirellula obstinata]|uniref:phosphoglycolate phosphatase n=1 Tax=Rubripirellula obstinata TaxID=406547 RepID=A0A5B1CD01_9BACT|nr:HAD family hydrolase [Rubripirellula obstinata]KAA1257609.1 Phosphoglycolate phosphatase [Rubripirellula obstinata]